MKCQACGFVSFDVRESCASCGAPLVSATGPGASAVPRAREPAAGQGDPRLPADLQFLRLEAETGMNEAPRAGARRRRSRPARAARGRTARDEEAVAAPPDEGFPADGADAGFAIEQAQAASESVQEEPAFCIEEDLFAPGAAAAGRTPAGTPHFVLDPPGSGEWASPALSDLDGPSLLLQGEGAGWTTRPVIDRDEEVPERFWAPEVAGLGRRSLALLVDQALLGAVLGLFFFGAWAALRLSGLESEALFAAAALQAALAPFALLALLLSLVYHAFFHGRDGRTPGKALAGVEVRTGTGAVPSLSRSILRWLAAALGLSCAGAGILWALFHPRKRGWADLLSATMVAKRRHAVPGEARATSKSDAPGSTNPP